jgi:hypothetical protein
MTYKKVRSFVLNFCLSSIFLFGYISQALAQEPARDAHIEEVGMTCGVRHDAGVEKILRGIAKQKRVPSYYRPEKPRDIIFKSDNIYVFRLAVCISSEIFNRTFNKDRNAVYQYWDELERYLIDVYGRDCGMRFDLIRDDKLILEENPLSLKEGTKLINYLIGSDRYDLGIVIKPQVGGMGGQGVLGGVFSMHTKGDAWAIERYSTVAHELGHLMGANHTHEKYDAKITEHGSGFSIMSYGEPRTFFSLFTVKEIRSSLSSLGYYTDKSRQTYVAGLADTKNAPYVVPLSGEKPQLDRDAIRHEYVVTRGTRYQFYIPVKNKDTHDFQYNAHSFDVGIPGHQLNLIQRLYDPSTENVVMFHPHYNKPFPSNDELTLNVRPYSDEYKNGLYTYCLSAFNHGYHDATLVKLRIVDGERFAITRTNLDADLFDRVTPGKSKINISWTPCRQLYGDDSKVRILLSTDFGKTFKYVLADEVPNTGTWSGVFPYVQIGKVFSDDAYIDVRGGVLKIEVIGEAAYALSAEVPYVCQGMQLIPTGGFITKNDNLVTFDPAPEIYKEIGNENELEDMPVLKASFGGSTVTASSTEDRIGNTVYRWWKAEVAGKSAVYTQVIKIKQPTGPDAGFRKKAEAMGALADELYHNIGKLGYPKAEIAQSKRMKELYEQVYDAANGKPKAALDAETVEALEEVLTDIGTIDEEQVVMPDAGKTYKIASYHDKYARERYFYLGQQATPETDPELIPDTQENGAEWFGGWVDDMYRFTTNNVPLRLSQTAKNLNGMRLVRGYTWGSFSFVSGGENPRIAQVDETGSVISFNELYSLYPIGSKSNSGDVIVSTDFRLFEVPMAFDVYYHTDNSTEVPSVLLSALSENGSEQPEDISEAMIKVRDGVYKVTVPKGYGHGKIVFTAKAGESVTISLNGYTAAYDAAGRRVFSINMPESKLASACLEFPAVVPEGMSAYTMDVSRSDSKQYALHLTKLEGAIPSHTPVLLSSDRPGMWDLKEADEAQKLPKLKEVFGSLPEISHDALNPDYLYFPLINPALADKQTATYELLKDADIIPAHSAYVRIYKYDGNQDVNEIVLDISALGNNVNGLTAVYGVNDKAENVYDLTGRIVRQAGSEKALAPGVYLVKGKKFVVK